MELSHFQAILGAFTNLSLGAVVLLLYSGASAWTDKLPAIARDAVIGLVFGLAVAGAMLNPVRIAPGIQITGAAPIIALSALFGGGVGGVLATAIGISMRLGIGGAGALSAAINIALALGVGLAIRTLAYRISGRIRFIYLPLQGILVTAISLASLTIIPVEFRASAWERMWMVILIVHPLGTVCLGALFIVDLQRRQALHQFAERDRQFQAIADNIPGAVYQMRLNEDGTLSYTYVSKGAEITAGVPTQAVVANAQVLESKFFAEEEADRWKYLRKSMETMAPGSREFRALRQDGSTRWLRTYSTPHKDEQGRFVWDGVTLDVSKEKTREQERLESERLFRGIVGNIPGAVWQLVEGKDGSRTYAFVSEGVKDLVGWSAEEMTQDPALQRQIYLAEDEPERLAALSRPVDPQGVRVRDYRVRRKDGELRWLRARSTAVPGEDGAVVWYGITTDITDERHREDALRENERRFRALVGNIPGTVWQAEERDDGSRAYTFLSEGFKDLTGWAPEEVMADPELWKRMYVDENQLDERDKSRLAVAPGTVRFREFQIRKRDGTERWLRARSTPFRMENGTIVWYGITTDFTEQKEREQEVQKVHAAMAESERRFRAIVENIPGLVHQTRLSRDGKLRFTYLSDRIQKAAGISPAAAVADAALVERMYLPEEEPERQRALLESAEHLTPLDRSFRIRLPNGRVEWRQVYATPHRDESGDTIWDGVTVDINASKLLEQELQHSNERLRESERRFRTLVANLPGVVFQAHRALDGKLTYLYLSEGAKQVYGIEAGEIMRDAKVLRRVLIPEDEDERKQAVREAMERPTLRVRDFRVRREDGSVAWMRSRAVPQPLPDGSVLWDGLTIDITAQKKMEEELRGSERLQALGQLTAGIAHQFNNILMIISGNTELLVAELSSDGRFVEALDQMQNAVARGSDITLGLQSFSRKESLAQDTRNVNDILVALRALTRTVVGPEVDLQLALEPALLPVHVDGDRLQNALLHLVLNARDAMPQGGRLEIATRNVELTEDEALSRNLPASRYVEITVRDYGAGMSPENMARAMEPFFTTKPVGQGTGLGLSTVHGFATQSGGRLELTSMLGQGTTVTLLLPADLRGGAASLQTDVRQNA